MKKFILFLLATLLTTFLFTQNKKGNLLVGVNIGGASASFDKNESYTSGSPVISKSDITGFNISIDPSVGYYVSDNIVIGTSLGLGFSSSKNENSSSGSTMTSVNKSHTMYVSLSPFGKFYFGGNRGKGMPFTEVNAGINFYPAYKGTSTFSNGGYEFSYDSYNSWNASIGIGYEHFINEVIGIQYFLGYNYSYSKYDTFFDYSSGTDYTYTNKNNLSYINFGVGLEIHLVCSKKKK